MGNINYNTLSDLQMDLLQLVRMPRVDCFILVEGGWCYENERDKIYFSKDVAEHRPCKTIDVKVILLFLLVS